MLQVMAISFFFFFILSVTSIEANCPTQKCSSQDIHFPFWLKDQKPPPNCGGSGFELHCKENKTIIRFPSYGDLVVKSISYKNKKLNLLDPKNCVHEVFLNLNLSSTPFKYYYVVKNYTYLNCSTKLSPLKEIPCLSGSKHFVYTVKSSSSLAVPFSSSSCRVMKTIAIPFAYSPYLSDNSFGLGLSWNLPRGGSLSKTELVKIAENEGFL